MEPKLHKISAVLKFLFNASLSNIIVEDLTFHDSKSEFTQPRYNLKSGRSSYHCSWIYHLKAKNHLSLKLNTRHRFNKVQSLVTSLTGSILRDSAGGGAALLIQSDGMRKRVRTDRPTTDWLIDCKRVEREGAVHWPWVVVMCGKCVWSNWSHKHYNGRLRPSACPPNTCYPLLTYPALFASVPCFL